MLSLLLLHVLAERESYGYEVVQRLHEIGLTDIAAGTVYPALSRLERERRLTARLVASTEDPPASTTGPPQRATRPSRRARPSGPPWPSWSRGSCLVPSHDLRKANDMPNDVNLLDRLRIERAVWSLDQRLYDLPRRTRIERRRELRSNLLDAARDTGTTAALRDMGDSGTLAAEYLDAELGRARGTHGWPRGPSC